MAPKMIPRLERVQTGVRLEKRLLKVLKALAEYLEVSLGELVELIALQAFEGTQSFSQGTLRRIADLKRVYNLDYDVRAAARKLFVKK
jgi:hypothetical protein